MTLPNLPTPLPKGSVQIGLSAAAREALDYYGLLLEADEAWVHASSRSLTVELLVHLAMGGNRRDFRPRSRRTGRPSFKNPIEDRDTVTRPAKIRLEAEKRARRAERARERLEEIRKDYELSVELAEQQARLDRRELER